MSIILRLTTAIFLHRKSRSILTVIGVAVAFFLAAVQFGLLVGWINTNTALIYHSGVDLWLMAEKTPAWDYGTAIPRQRIYQARSVPGVIWAEGLFMAWNTWQCPDGRRVNVELVGLDKTNIGGPWQLQAGTLDSVHQSQTVIVDELFLDKLGISNLGDTAEMYGERAIVGGISRGIRTFTASPHVFTSIEQAIRYDHRYRDEEITYVLARCSPGSDVGETQSEMRRRIPHVEVLTTNEFAWRSAEYWMLGTGIGITVVLTAILGLAVGAVITSQTLFAMTQEHLHHYATLLALGFGQSTLTSVVLVQSLALGLSGVLFGSIMFYFAGLASARTPIPLEMTSAVYFGLAVVSLTTCTFASFVSLRTILKIDPVVVFRQ